MNCSTKRLDILPKDNRAFSIMPTIFIKTKIYIKSALKFIIQNTNRYIFYLYL